MKVGLSVNLQTRTHTQSWTLRPTPAERWRRNCMRTHSENNLGCIAPRTRRWSSQLSLTLTAKSYGGRMAHTWWTPRLLQWNSCLVTKCQVSDIGLNPRTWRTWAQDLIVPRELVFDKDELQRLQSAHCTLELMFDMFVPENSPKNAYYKTS